MMYLYYKNVVCDGGTILCNVEGFDTMLGTSQKFLLESFPVVRTVLLMQVPKILFH